MKVNQNLCVLFWLRKSKSDENGLCPVYARLTIEGARIELSLGKKVHPDKWLSKSGLMKGNSEEARTFNSYLNLVKGDLQKHYNLLAAQVSRVKPEMVRNAYLGIREEQKTLLHAFDHHNLKFKEKADAGYLSDKTLQKYETTRQKLVDFMQHQYKVSDIALADLKLLFLNNFEHYLLTNQKLHTNTANKYIKNLKKVVTMAQAMEWLPTNPFTSFKCSYITKDREVLTQDDLDTLYEKQIHIQRLAEVRDVFLFCCYTGFAYNEVEALPHNAVQKGIDGEKWLSINRAKTGTLESVMILPIPLEIIERYQEHPYCKVYNKLLPVNSNQKYNAYLKELADICGINIKLTTHIARHTFATTVTLANDVPIETVSALLGHREIKTTQIYAKVVKKKVSNDMKSLRNRLQQNTEKPIIELNSRAGS
jgi:site-specific recombinase XerD